MKVKPRKFDEVNLYRHPDYALPPTEETKVVKQEPHQTPVKFNGILRTRTDHLNETIAGEFDDEFDGNLFDGVEISEQQVDDSSLAAAEEVPRAIEAAKLANTPHGAASTRNTPVTKGGPPRPPIRGHTVPAPRGPNGAPQPPTHQQPPQNQGPGRPQAIPPNSRGPQTPMQQQNISRSDQFRPRPPAPTVDIHAAPRPANQIPQNQPLRPSPPQPQPEHGSVTGATTTPQTRPTGFVTSRAAELVQASESATGLNHIPAFNPHADSAVPKEMRTPGIDHTSSRPIKRQELGGANGQQPVAPAQSTAGTNGGFNRLGPPVGRPGNSNFVNPQQDMNRRIGMPAGGGAAMSPTLNRNAYRPPSKRPPLQDVSNAKGGAAPTGEPESKKRKLEPVADGPVGGAENAAPVGST